MAEKDLIPFKPKGDKRSDMLRKRQIGSSSLRRKQAQQQRRRIERIKNMSAKELEKRGIEVLNNPVKFDLEILFLIQELLKKDLDDKIKLELIAKMTQVKGAIWGTVSKSLNVNIDKTMSNKMQEIWDIVQKEETIKNKKNKKNENDKKQ